MFMFIILPILRCFNFSFLFLIFGIVEFVNSTVYMRSNPEFTHTDLEASVLSRGSCLWSNYIKLLANCKKYCTEACNGSIAERIDLLSIFSLYTPV